MKLPILYKRAVTGTTLTWEIEVEDNKHRTLSGQIDGAITITEWTVCYGKNNGKINGTTDAEQAAKDAESKWKKKQEREHYTPDIAAAQAGERKFLEPMLAQKFNDRKDKIKWGKEDVYGQLKLNGVRCVATKDGLFSRKGKRYVSAPHIEQHLQPFFELHPNIALDGELFNNSLRQKLNKLVSLVRQEDPTKSDLEQSADLVQFHVYDYFNTSLSTHTLYSSRHVWLESVVGSKYGECIQLVPNCKLNSIEEADKYLVKVEEQGHEGIMIRLDGCYEHKRSKNLLKHKSFVDDEFTIVDIIEGEGNLTGKVGKFCFIAHNGNPFKSSPVGTHDLWEQMWNDRIKLIGQKATVKYKELTPVGDDGSGGVPSFGKVMAVRNYE